MMVVEKLPMVVGGIIFILSLFVIISGNVNQPKTYDIMDNPENLPAIYFLEFDKDEQELYVNEKNEIENKLLHNRHQENINFGIFSAFISGTVLVLCPFLDRFSHLLDKNSNKIQ